MNGPRALQTAGFVALGLLAALVLARLLGAAVPREAIVGALLVYGASRVARDFSSGPAGRRRLPVFVALTLVTAYLILMSR